MGKELVTPFQKFVILSHREYQHHKLAGHGKQRENNRWSSEKILYLDQASQVSLSFFLFQVFIVQCLYYPSWQSNLLVY